jgi:Fuc2NAc and GlcNAc transferase
MLIFLILFLLSVSSVWAFRCYAIKKKIFDIPSQRSSHIMPTPRGGGIVFPILWISYLLVNYFLGNINPEYLLIFIPSVIFLGLIGFLDDCLNIGAKWRFLAQFIASIYGLYLLGGYHSVQIGIWSINFAWLGSVIAILAIVWSTNLYNFMDGIDGIATIEALFVFGVGGYFIWCAGGYELAKLIWAMAVIVAGFLMWNSPPAKIFMGDVGSALLGFLVMLFAIAGEVWYQVPALLWIILYGVFWFDATATLIRRIIHGDVWYQAHRLHAYQRLHHKGWSHKKTLFGVIVINILLAILALIANYFPSYVMVWFFGALLILIVSYLLVERWQPMYDSRSE